jgi:hypothetical protein
VRWQARCGIKPSARGWLKDEVEIRKARLTDIADLLVLINTYGWRDAAADGTGEGAGGRGARKRSTFFVRIQVCRRIFPEIGVEDIGRGELPLKAWKDSLRCAKFQACDEIAMLKRLKADPITPVFEKNSAGLIGVPEILLFPVLHK